MTKHTEWQVGDLALCVKLDAWVVYDGPLTGPEERPEPGKIYPVAEVVSDPVRGLHLCFVEFGTDLFVADRFIKVTPPEADEYDREVIDLMTGEPEIIFVDYDRTLANAAERTAALDGF